MVLLVTEVNQNRSNKLSMSAGAAECFSIATNINGRNEECAVRHCSPAPNGLRSQVVMIKNMEKMVVN